MCRSDGNADRKRSDELHLDRRLIRHTKCGNAGLNDHDYVYSYRHNKWLQQYSGIDGYGKSVTKC